MNLFKKESAMDLKSRLEAELEQAEKETQRRMAEIERLDCQIELGDATAEKARISASEKRDHALALVERKKNALKYAVEECSKELAATEKKRAAALWQAQEQFFEEIMPLADSIPEAVANLVSKIKRIEELCLEAFTKHPQLSNGKLHNTLFFDSPLGPKWSEAHLRMALRRHDYRWAYEWYDSNDRIPKLSDHLNGAKSWVFMKRPKDM